MFQFTIAATNNPTRIRFVSNQPLGEDEVDFDNVDDAGGFPLIQQLFYLPFVKHVRLTENWIEVERFDILEWPDVQDEVATQLADYLNQGGKVKMQANQKEAITVYAESTPNPAAIKFVCSKRIVGEIYKAKNIEEAKNSPLVTELFQKAYIKEVFMDENFISITKLGK